MVGKLLAHYKILDELGRGGMGIVYKAKDTKLDRSVAIKVLPPQAINSEEDRARFYREAKAAAQLHHPNIASIFQIDEAVPEGMHKDDVRPFIAMEFIDGESIAERIPQGTIPLEDCLRIAKQVASGLEAAHEKDIVHRDIKTGNIMLTKKGDAKILDFGLAQTTNSTKLTQLGSTLGTVAYMSPEQARGEVVDLRTDLWALGVVLYEMIAGKHPFPGEYEQAVIYSILNQNPAPLTSVRAGVPLQLEWLVDKLLVKSAAERYQATADIVVDLKKIDLGSREGIGPEFQSSSGEQQQSVSGPIQVHSPSGSVQPASFPSSGTSARSAILQEKKVALPVGIIISVIIAGLLLGGYIGSRPEESDAVNRPIRKLLISTGNLPSVGDPRISPDGNYVAFIHNVQDPPANVIPAILDLQSSEVVSFPEFTGTRISNFSPNSQWLVSGTADGIMKVRVPDGDPFPLSAGADASWPIWESDSSILFSEGAGLYRMDQNGQSIELIVEADSSLGHFVLWCGMGSRVDERHFVCSAAGNRRTWAAIVDVEDGTYETILENAMPTIYLQSGHLLFGRGPNTNKDYMVQRLNSATFQLVGEIVPLGLRNIYMKSMSIDRNGSLVYQSPGTTNETRLSWFDRTLGVLGSGPFIDPALSPDGSRMVYENQSGDLHVLDLETGVDRTLTSDGLSSDPSWSPDSRIIYFVAHQDPQDVQFRIYMLDLNSNDPPVPVQGTREVAGNPVVSPDGMWMAYTTGRNTGFRAYLGKLDGPLFVETDSLGPGFTKNFSPDGKFLLWIDGIGGRGTIYVKDLDGGASSPCCEVNRVGFQPVHWRTDNSGFFYTDENGNLFEVPVELGETVRFLSEPRLMDNIGVESSFTVDPSSGEILLIDPVEDPESERFVIVQNWIEDLKRIAPVE